METIKYNISIKTLSNLHIGGSTNIFDIGETDSFVIKNSLTNKPYIPGSSIKGKLRSLLEYRYGKVVDGKLVIEKKEIRKIFEPVEEKNKIGISRAIFRDANLTKKSAELLEERLGKNIYTDIKVENTIDRLKGTSENIRYIEVVPANVEFEGEICLLVFAEEKEEMENYIKEALDMLEANYLGGNGTRGYGEVKIQFKKNNEE